jgi:hypothetical protein
VVAGALVGLVGDVVFGVEVAVGVGLDVGA